MDEDGFSPLATPFIVTTLLLAAGLAACAWRYSVFPEHRAAIVPVAVWCSLSFLLALLLSWGMGLTDTRAMLALLLSGGWIALVGFIDDHRHVPARWRLLGHFLGAAFLLYMLGGLPALSFAGARWDLGL
ncbi:hypothetical protein R2K36_32790, partial [Pseudomonas aeruginosa]